ncbi:Na+/H+ antiporter subunit G [Alkalicoccobacillus murimartini]|uniref:Multicomponent Na+:H+ antiporter subunit G n=1 Tax=Alkalicoccobacillus murimartini TaxID=171685 RepID=A0ABT9YIY3_9BACI|nr:Na+/H+ antiporter subunit G [Alkalicoccobacillus murimartini]MDQ0207814.1 multicomponent Na+:H+ antiporter subunit G [Alkalicoccobacillus murimartini]
MSVSGTGEIIAAVLILIGTLMSVISAYGLIRLPDVYTRSHAGTKSATLGVLSTLTGTFIFFWLVNDFISVRLLLGIVFVFLTAPVAGHLISRAAYHSGVPMTETSVQDQLKEDLEAEEKKQSGEKD